MFSCSDISLWIAHCSSCAANITKVIKGMRGNALWFCSHAHLVLLEIFCGITDQNIILLGQMKFGYWHRPCFRDAEKFNTVKSLLEHWKILEFNIINAASYYTSIKFLGIMIVFCDVLRYYVIWLDCQDPGGGHKTYVGSCPYPLLPSLRFRYQRGWPMRLDPTHPILRNSRSSLSSQVL